MVNLLKSPICRFRNGHPNPVDTFRLTGMTPEIPDKQEMDAFDRGCEAFNRGAEQDANPYFDNHLLRSFWFFGWLSKCEDAKKNTSQ